jgi:hypothetical protein
MYALWILFQDFKNLTGENFLCGDFLSGFCCTYYVRRGRRKRQGCPFAVLSTHAMKIRGGVYVYGHTF